jgi:hypothetical protein
MLQFEPIFMFIGFSQQDRNLQSGPQTSLLLLEWATGNAGV